MNSHDIKVALKDSRRHLCLFDKTTKRNVLAIEHIDCTDIHCNECIMYSTELFEEFITQFIQEHKDLIEG